MKRVIVPSILLMVLAHGVQAAEAVRCEYLLGARAEVLTPKAPWLRDLKITAGELGLNASKKFADIPEFSFIRDEAEKRGLRVWLFGGTASSYLHYVKWDIARTKGLKDLQGDRFDYDFTNIFRSTQDLDIVVDATAEQAKEFEKALGAKFPHFLGAKTQWEVRTLRTRMGTVGTPTFKEALLDDADFSNQNSDSNSLGMVEVTRSKEPVIRDLRHWNEVQSPFLNDTLNNRISFFRSPKHFTTVRAQAGQNPEILSVIRLLVKAFQYELDFSAQDFQEMKSVVDQFNPKAPMSDEARRFIDKTAKKLIMHATNIEYAMNKLDELGLRPKLIAMGNKQDQDSAAWWLNKEPLRSQSVGQGAGKTAKDWGLQIVAHETGNFLAYESITRSHSGEPNVLISRQNTTGEAAAYGNGFYTRIGKVGARGTGLTIRFNVNPQAREGADFTVHGDYIVFQNKKALKVIQESLDLSLDDILKIAETKGPGIDQSDKALIEKLKRKMNATRVNDELEKLLNSKDKNDHQRLMQILAALDKTEVKKLFSNETLSAVTKNLYSKLYLRIEPLSHSMKESDQLRYISETGKILNSLKSVGLVKLEDFYQHLESQSKNPTASFKMRKAAALEGLLATPIDPKRALTLPFKTSFSDRELKQVSTEIQKWSASADPRKQGFYEQLRQKWWSSIKFDETLAIDDIVQSRLFDVNQLNPQGYSALQLAAYYEHQGILEVLIASPEFNMNAKNSEGFTEVEQLRLTGQKDLADEIQRQRPEARSRALQIKERNEDGSPLVAFVKIRPGKFLSLAGYAGELMQLTKSFEILSVPTTQKQWQDVVYFLHQNFPGEFKDLYSNPSEHRGSQLPVEHVSYEEIQLWMAALNRLSQSDLPEAQKLLASLFPGHKKGHHYRLPTEAERDYVQRNQGLAEGAYSFSNKPDAIEEHAWMATNSSNRTHDVGLKKPVLISGQPVYDLDGNVAEWVQDWFAVFPPSGVDPTGPAKGSQRVIVGSSYKSDSWYLKHGNARTGYGPNTRSSVVGFRLVRDP